MFTHMYILMCFYILYEVFYELSQLQVAKKVLKVLKNVLKLHVFTNITW